MTGQKDILLMQVEVEVEEEVRSRRVEGYQELEHGTVMTPS